MISWYGVGRAAMCFGRAVYGIIIFIMLHWSGSAEYYTYTLMNNSAVSHSVYAVNSRYLELGYFEFCKVRSVYLNRKPFWLLFYKSKLPDVQINLHFGWFELVKKSPINFVISKFDCIFYWITPLFRTQCIYCNIISHRRTETFEWQWG